METQYQEFFKEMETLFRNFTGVGSILTAMLDGADAGETTLEHMVNASFALNDYLSSLLDRMDRAILRLDEEPRGKALEVSA
mgnify:FL=1